MKSKLICPICKKEFIRKSSTHKYCTKKCCIIAFVEYHKEYAKQYYKIHKKEVDKYIIKWNQIHKKERDIYFKNYRLTHKNERNKYHQSKLKLDINYKIKSYLRCRLNLALKGNPKLETTMKLVGCSIEKLKKHLEKKFEKGMNWNNYGKNGWEIDHIRPCASFDLQKPSEQRKCFHYTNLQPLWQKENSKKHTKIIKEK